MRVLHVTPSVARRDGGPSEVIRGLIPALRSLGIDANVATTRKGLGDADSDLGEVDWIHLEQSQGPSNLTYSRGLAEHLQSSIGGYDLVHVHGLQSYVGTQAMRTARLQRVPYIVEPHGALNAFHWSRNNLRKRAYRVVFDAKNWHGLSAVKYSSRTEEVQGQRVLPELPSFVIPLGVDESLFDVERNVPTVGPPLILYMGRITKVKRLDLLLQSMLEDPLTQLGARLVVAGEDDGTLGFNPVEYARTNGLEHRVQFVGTVGARRRAELFSQATIFCLPSRDESFGLAVAEAMAAGLPAVVGENVGLAADAAASGALLTASQDPVNLAACIAKGISDAQILGDNARRYASEKFSWSNAALLTASAYASTIQTQAKDGND